MAPSLRVRRAGSSRDCMTSCQTVGIFLPHYKATTRPFRGTTASLQSSHHPIRTSVSIHATSVLLRDIGSDIVRIWCVWTNIAAFAISLWLLLSRTLNTGRYYFMHIISTLVRVGSRFSIRDHTGVPHTYWIRISPKTGSPLHIANNIHNCYKRLATIIYYWIEKSKKKVILS